MEKLDTGVWVTRINDLFARHECDLAITIEETSAPKRFNVFIGTLEQKENGTALGSISGRLTVNEVNVFLTAMDKALSLSDTNHGTLNRRKDWRDSLDPEVLKVVSAWTAHSFKEKYGARTMGDIQDLTDRQILKIRGIGKAMLKRIREYGKEELPDLFETPEELPDDVRAIVEKYGDMEQTYANCEALLAELTPHGYTFEYYLDAMPFGLRKVN